jgi:hypothetical protein
MDCSVSYDGEVTIKLSDSTTFPLYAILILQCLMLLERLAKLWVKLYVVKKMHNAVAEVNA